MPTPLAASPALEGGLDVVMGAIGVGPETPANLVGQLVAPFGAAKGISPSAKRLLYAGDAARLEQAAAMGFRTNIPLYRRTAADIRSFDLARGGRTSGGQVGSLAVSTARNPEVAAEFADLAAPQGSGQNILQLFHRTQKPGVDDLKGTETNAEVAATIAEAWHAGFVGNAFEPLQ